MINILLKIITFMHVMFVLFIVFSPVTNSNYILMLHSIMVPFLMAHWICNDDTCVLTIIERNLRKKVYNDKYKDDDCFTCKLIEPVYNFIDDYKTFSSIIYFIVIILWLISTGKIYYKYRNGLITNWKQLFIL